MRFVGWFLASSVTCATLACGDNSAAKPEIAGDLRRDLQTAATSDGLQLATSQDHRRTSVVSDIERTGGAVPIHRSPRRKPVPKPKVGSQPEDARSVDVQRGDVVAPQVPAPEPAQAVPSTDVPRVPVVAPRPAPAPVAVLGDQGDDRSAQSGSRQGSPDIGDIIGVIMRGGRGGDDHCVPRRRSPRVPFPRGGHTVIWPLGAPTR